MPEAAVATAGEAALAESFAVAAPEMFIPEAAMGAEFGTAAAFDAAGAGALGAGALGLEGLGMAGLEGIGAAAPSLGEAVTQGILTGGPGAGAAGINEAMLAEQQARAVAAANSGMSPIASQAIQPTQVGQTVLPGESFSVVDPATRGLQAAPTIAETTPAGIDTVQAGSAINKPYISYDPQFGANVTPSYLPSAMAPPAAAPSGLQAGFQQALDFAKQNPLSAASMGYTAYSLLKKPPAQEESEEYNGILTKYKMSPNFKGRQANPADFQYTPKMYAEGGIMQAYAGGGPVEAMSNANAIGANTGYPMADINKGEYATPWQTPISRNVIADAADTGVNPMTGEMRFAYGGKTSSELAMDYYDRMTRRPDAPAPARGPLSGGIGHDAGIYYDLDPDTRYLDPVTAAQIRQAKVNKRANVQLPSMKRPTPMGQINLAPPGMKAQDGGGMTEAAQGGIMSLGGYAAGGNPRLLKGPGDGMSDNIPATIANKQPARLADGEFVVPADVVSHLGNGSTDAGAKKLHQMMTNVRKARTGNPKQGKQIKPEKYIPT